MASSNWTNKVLKRQHQQRQQAPSSLPGRPSHAILYQPPDVQSSVATSMNQRLADVPLSNPSFNELSDYLDEQQRIYDDLQRQRQQKEASTPSHIQPQRSRPLPPPPPPPPRPTSIAVHPSQQEIIRSSVTDRASNESIGNKPPVSERIPEFRLDIPNGVLNMTQHPGDTIVGSMVITVTKPTRAQCITLYFCGQERVHLRDTSNQSPIPSTFKIEYPLFEMRLTLWGHDPEDGGGQQLEVLQPGTLSIPFSIKIPHVNYPSTMKRDDICRVKYNLWARLERPGTFKDHKLNTAKEVILMDPAAYPARPREALRLKKLIQQTARHENDDNNIAVQIEGGLSQLPAMAGDRLMYKLEAQALKTPSLAPSSQYRVKYMKLCVVERVNIRGLIRSSEQSQAYRTDLHTISLEPVGQLPGKNSNMSQIFAATGYIRLPVDICPFVSKHISRSYELRIECEVADQHSLLGKVTRQTSKFLVFIPLDICTVSPDNFSQAALQNAYTDETLNIAGLAPPPHHQTALEPVLCMGGWEARREFVRWDKNNPTWVELAARKQQ